MASVRLLLPDELLAQIDATRTGPRLKWIRALIYKELGIPEPKPLATPRKRAEPAQTNAPHSALLDLNNASAYLDVREYHLRQLTRDRRIPFVKFGNKIRFRVSDLDAYINAATVPATR